MEEAFNIIKKYLNDKFECDERVDYHKLVKQYSEFLVKTSVDYAGGKSTKAALQLGLSPANFSHYRKIYPDAFKNYPKKEKPTGDDYYPPEYERGLNLPNIDERVFLYKKDKERAESDVPDNYGKPCHASDEGLRFYESDGWAYEELKNCLESGSLVMRRDLYKRSNYYTLGAKASWRFEKLLPIVSYCTRAPDATDYEKLMNDKKYIIYIDG